MVDEERNHQTEAGDPFSVFGELTNINSEAKHGLHLFSSKLNELLLEVTMTKNGEDGISESERQLIQEAIGIYASNMERLQRAHNLIDAAREAHNKQG